MSASRALESSWRRLGWLRRSRLGRRRAGFVAPPPPGWIHGAAAASQGSPQLPHRRKGGETAERAKKSLPATLIARKSLHRRSGTTGKTSIRPHPRTPGCGGAGVQHGSRATESAAAASQCSPQLPHRRKGGETAERGKNSLPATQIARKSLLRGGWRGRPRSGASTTRNAWRLTYNAERMADGGRRGRRGRRGTHSARHTARNPMLTTHSPHRGWPPTDRAGAFRGGAISA